MHWDQRKYQRTIAWDPSTNTGRFRSAAGSNKYRVFAATVDESTNCETNETLHYQCMDCTGPHLIPDEEDEVRTTSAPDPMVNPHAINPVSIPDTLITDVREENLTDVTTEDVLPPPTSSNPTTRFLLPTTHKQNYSDGTTASATYHSLI